MTPNMIVPMSAKFCSNNLVVDLSWYTRGSLFVIVESVKKGQQIFYTFYSYARANAN